MHLCNTFTLSLTGDDDYSAILKDPSALNLPDGVPVAIFGDVTRRNGPVRGADLFRTTVSLGVEKGLRHFFLGGEHGVPERMTSVFRSHHPGIEIAGALSPEIDPLCPVLAQEDLDLIRFSRPEIVWVGLGTPKQDHVAHQIALALSIPAVAVGAAFDFVAGTRKEAPTFLQGTGAEWIFRLIQEPQRLFKRYALSIPKFLFLVFRGYARRNRDAN